MIKKISIVITILLVALIGILSFRVKQEEKSRAIRMQELNEQAFEYEEKIQNLEDALEEKRNELEANGKDYGSICVTVKVSTFEELELAEEWTSSFDYPLCVVLSADMSEEDQEDIIDSLADNSEWSFMLEATELQHIDRTAEIYEKLADEELTDSGILYLADEATEEQIAQMQQAGWKGYSNSLGNASGIRTVMSDTGLSQIGHVLLAEENSLRAVIEDSISSGNLFFLSIEMNRVNKSFTKESVIRILETIDEDYIATGGLVAVSLDEYLEEFEVGREERVAMQEEYDRYEAKCQEEIEVLEDKIIQLYEDFN